MLVDTDLGILFLFLLKANLLLLNVGPNLLVVITHAKQVTILFLDFVQFVLFGLYKVGCVSFEASIDVLEALD